MYDKPWICVYCREDFSQPVDNCTFCYRSEIVHKHRFEKMEEKWKRDIEMQMDEKTKKKHLYWEMYELPKLLEERKKYRESLGQK